MDKKKWSSKVGQRINAIYLGLWYGDDLDERNVLNDNLLRGNL